LSLSLPASGFALLLILIAELNLLGFFLIECFLVRAQELLCSELVQEQHFISLGSGIL
jgi:phosphoribosylaminoimidazole carboxylase (NCAIR synthetase)